MVWLTGHVMNVVAGALLEEEQPAHISTVTGVRVRVCNGVHE